MGFPTPPRREGESEEEYQKRIQGLASQLPFMFGMAANPQTWLQSIGHYRQLPTAAQTAAPQLSKLGVSSFFPQALKNTASSFNRILQPFARSAFGQMGGQAEDFFAQLLSKAGLLGAAAGPFGFPQPEPTPTIGTAGRDIPEAGPAGWVQNYFRTNNTAPLMADPNAEPGGTFAARFGRDFIPQRSPNLGFLSSMGPTGPFLPSQPVTTPGGRTPMPTAQNPNRFSPIGVRSSVQTKKPASRPTPRRR